MVRAGSRSCPGPNKPSSESWQIKDHFFLFEYGKIHFVSVDFGYHLGQKQIRVNGQNLEYPTNEVQPMHVEWMRQDMAHRKAGTFVVTTSEADLTRHCPGFLEMARQNDVRLQLVGDDHIVAYKARAVPYRTGGALSGCWWTPAARELCPDLSPQGYLIYRVAGERMECFYKGLGQRVAIVSHRVGAPWKGRVKVQAHLVQPQSGETLEYSLNGTDWKPMEECDRPFYRARYEAVVDGCDLLDTTIFLAPQLPAESRSDSATCLNHAGFQEYPTEVTP